jgi:hypothetical protein
MKITTISDAVIAALIRKKSSADPDFVIVPRLLRRSPLVALSRRRH